MRKSRHAVRGWCIALGLYLAAEALLPAGWQPSARLGVALIHAYQATGSHVLESSGVRCRYQPSCSHYAEDAISHYGTLNGGVRAAGRIFRCSPWGGAGYDPAVETHSAAYLAPEPQESNTKHQQELSKEDKEALFAACLTGGLGCALAIGFAILVLAVKIFMIVWVYKDSKARGDQNAVLWIVLLIFTNIIGFVIYLAARPKGELVPCPNCHEKKMDVLTKCPHCNADIPPAAKSPQA